MTLLSGEPNHTRCGPLTQITVKVVPGSSRTEYAGLHNDMYKIKIAAPPEKGKANKMLVDFLATQFGIRKKDVQIKSGQTHSIKKVLLEGVSSRDVDSFFLQKL